MVELLKLAGFEITGYGAIERGSWFQRIRVRGDSAAKARLIGLLDKGQRAAELGLIGKPRSENDEREANAIAMLARATADHDEVAIRTSSILFLKAHGRVHAWVLSE